MNKFNVFVVLSIVAAAAMFGAMVTPALAQDNMTMTMPMDNMTMPMDNMTMTDNSTGMGNGTMTVN